MKMPQKVLRDERGEASLNTQQHVHGNATAAVLTALGPPQPPRINIVASSMTIWGQKEI